MKFWYGMCLTAIVVHISNAANLNSRSNRSVGGPDAFGYSWIDSSEENGPIFNWIDITTVGTNMNLSGDDVTNSSPINLPWPFPFYGIDKMNFRVCTNGFINFGSSSVAYGNTTLPASGLPNDQIAVFWDDLTTSGHGSIWYYYDVYMNRFIIEWFEVQRYGQQYVYNTFEAILYPNGRIVLQYLSIDSTNYSATIGIEDNNGAIGLQTHFNGAGMPITNSRAVRYIPPNDLDTDFAPPVINHIPLANTDINGPYTVSANIADENGNVSWAILYYSVDGNPFIPVEMENQMEHSWTADIPDQAGLISTIEYFIVAADDADMPNRAICGAWTFNVVIDEERITNVNAVQRLSTRLIDVGYDLWTNNDLNATISAICSLDNGISWTIIPQTVSGAIGQNIAPGVGRTFTWDAGEDLPNVNISAMKIRLTACQNWATQEMVLIPAGQFVMGQAGVTTPEHSATLTHNLLLGRTEVTNAQFLDALNWAKEQGLVSIVGDYVQQYGMNLLRINESGLDYYEIRFNTGTQMFYLQPGTYDAGSWGPGHAYPGGSYDPADQPAKFVSWYGAACYCDWRSQMENLPLYYQGQWGQIPNPRNPYVAAGYRLPTEAEWEFAAQYDDERSYPWGPTTPSCTQANYRPSGYCFGWTSPAGAHPAGASGQGLQDMAGNVWEWCNDWYAVYTSSPVTDPQGPSTGSYRVLRGGCWYDGATYLPCAYRYYFMPSTASRGYGFRLCRIP